MQGLHLVFHPVWKLLCLQLWGMSARILHHLVPSEVTMCTPRDWTINMDIAHEHYGTLQKSLSESTALRL